MKSTQVLSRIMHAFSLRRWDDREDASLTILKNLPVGQEIVSTRHAVALVEKAFFTQNNTSASLVTELLDMELTGIVIDMPNNQQAGIDNRGMTINNYGNLTGAIGSQNSPSFATGHLDFTFTQALDVLSDYAQHQEVIEVLGSSLPPLEKQSQLAAILSKLSGIAINLTTAVAAQWLGQQM